MHLQLLYVNIYLLFMGGGRVSLISLHEKYFLLFTKSADDTWWDLRDYVVIKYVLPMLHRSGLVCQQVLMDVSSIKDACAVENNDLRKNAHVVKTIKKGCKNRDKRHLSPKM